MRFGPTMFAVSAKSFLRHDEISYDVNVCSILLRNDCPGDTLKTAEEFFQHVRDGRKVGPFGDPAVA